MCIVVVHAQLQIQVTVNTVLSTVYVYVYSSVCSILLYFALMDQRV